MKEVGCYCILRSINFKVIESLKSAIQYFSFLTLRAIYTTFSISISLPIPVIWVYWPLNVVRLVERAGNMRRQIPFIFPWDFFLKKEKKNFGSTGIATKIILVLVAWYINWGVDWIEAGLKVTSDTGSRFRFMLALRRVAVGSGRAPAMPNLFSITAGPDPGGSARRGAAFGWWAGVAQLASIGSALGDRPTANLNKSRRGNIKTHLLSLCKALNSESDWNEVQDDHRRFTSNGRRAERSLEVSPKIFLTFRMRF